MLVEMRSMFIYAAYNIVWVLITIVSNGVADPAEYEITLENRDVKRLLYARLSVQNDKYHHCSNNFATSVKPPCIASVKAVSPRLLTTLLSALYLRSRNTISVYP